MYLNSDAASFPGKRREWTDWSRLLLSPKPRPPFAKIEGRDGPAYTVYDASKNQPGLLPKGTGNSPD